MINVSSQSKIPEASTLSKSQSQIGDANTRNALVTGTTSWMDKIFPLYEELLKNISIPSFFYQIMILYASLQILIVATWPTLDLIDKESLAGKILVYLRMIALMSDLKDTEQSYIIGFIIFTIFFLCLILILVIQGVIYQKNRRFITWTLYITRFIVDIIPVVVVIPLGAYIGSLFYRMYKGPTVTEIVFFVLAVIYEIPMAFFLYIESYFFSFSPYISVSPSACWSGKFHFGFVFGSSLFIPLSYFFKIFTDWFIVILFVIKIVFNLFNVILVCNLPLVHTETNGIVGTLFVASTGWDIFFLVQYFGVKIDTVYVYAVLFPLIIVSVFVYKILITKIIKKVVKNLKSAALESIGVDEKQHQQPPKNNMPNSGFIQDEARRELFHNARLDSSLNRCLLYLRVGVSQMCDLFLDWSLVKYVAEFHDDAETLCTICQLISYFPSESRLLNYFFVQVTAKTGLKYHQRFIIYQIHRVKGLRQSSASSEITDKLMEMKNLTHSGFSQVKNFWMSIPNDPAVLYQIRAFTEQTDSLFNEAIEKWPNNVRLCEDYSIFLIECATNFTQGLKIKHRADLIEQGKNFAVDLSFRSLCRAYPFYLKRGIVDVKGNFLQQKSTGSRRGSSNNSNSQLSTGTVDGDLDAEIEEQLAKASFSFHRLRLAYQRCLNGRRCHNSYRLKASAIWTVTLSVISLLFVFGFYFERFNPRSDNMKRQLNLNEFRFAYDSSLTMLGIQWFKSLGFMSNDFIDSISRDFDSSANHSLYFNKDNLMDEATRWIVFMRDQLSMFLNAIVELASEGADVHKIMHVMIDQALTGQYCDGSYPVVNELFTNSFKYILSFLMLQLRFLTMNDEVLNSQHWNESKRMCLAISNIPFMAPAFDGLAGTISNDQEDQRDESTKLNTNLVVPVVILFVAFTLPFLVIFVRKTFVELRNLLHMMQDFDDKIRTEAAKPLKATTMDDVNDQINDVAVAKGYSESSFYFMVVLPPLIGAAIFGCGVYLAQYNNDKFLTLNKWMTLGIARGNYIIEIIYFTMFSMVSKNNMTTGFMNSTTSSGLTFTLLSTLKNYNNMLLRGSGDIKSSIGENEELDKINLDEVCVTPEKSENFQETYQCASLDRGINVFYSLATSILNNLDNQTFERDSNFYHLFNLGNVYMLDKSSRSAEIMASFSEQQISAFQSQLAGLSFGGIAFMVVTFLGFWQFLKKIDIAYQGALQMLRCLPPTSVQSNQALLNYILNRTSEKTVDKMNASKSVIHMSHDAVFCLNRSETIEVINNTVTSLFGYSPDQMLGQPLSQILPNEMCTDVYHHLNLMRNGQCALSFETTCVGITDDESSIPVHATLLGITDDNSNIAKSFVIILRDETQLQKQRKAAEEAKAQSEKLLYQILPRDIVVRLNHGETDISFTVPSATIIFIDVVKFSEYAAALSPAQIMENLSTVFAAFDNICQNYNLITKIKLIGDVYMAAGGLFGHESPVSHACQIVQFGLDVLNVLEDINSQLNSNLQVRIGVNTDGPLIAGVLGTDKPIFDIIGDPINVASRLQSTGIPGSVQISQSTYDLINSMNFNIEQRGEVVLKGKGKKMAYLVRQTAGSFFIHNDVDSNTAGMAINTTGFGSSEIVQIVPANSQ